MYSLMNVAYLKPQAKLPGLSLISDMRNWNKCPRYSRTFAPLANINWIEKLQNKDIDTKQVDKLALEHLNTFWDRYGLQFPFAIEHKDTNFFLRASYIGKGHYMIRRLDGNDYYKIRGAKEFKDEDKLTKHPTYELLKNSVEGSDIFPSSMDYNHKSLLSITKWTTAQKSKEGFKNIKELRPGYEVIENRTARYNNTHCHIQDEVELSKRADRKTVEKGNPIKWFERYGEKGTNKVINTMNEDNLRL